MYLFWGFNFSGRNFEDSRGVLQDGQNRRQLQLMRFEIDKLFQMKKVQKLTQILICMFVLFTSPKGTLYKD